MGHGYGLLAGQPFVAGMTDWQLDWLSRHARRAVFPAGARLFVEGAPADRFWLVDRGMLEVDADLPGRGRVVIETLGPGTVLGWSWFFPPYRWNFGAVARQTTYAVELDGPGVRELCQRDPLLGFELTHRLLRVVVDRLQVTRHRLHAAIPEPSPEPPPEPPPEPSPDPPS
ncbi:cyclic nucleotide-binding domain-containing protein [Plantactinospora sp. KBS50]|uniref:cyclic nucleotide-binding domain-containing protein n=1 Tax=Plantactinospora sp. KBS50 TaxID=2024580 RepID=UPI000BAAC3CB|nr:cyclic nucleotide-binding domain-containing protein [Plantactinospora sp. KBS50]ASW54966.1 hypothetical protein CIK06_13375 [Plantactinospora sp. KBS50]